MTLSCSHYWENMCEKFLRHTGEPTHLIKQNGFWSNKALLNPFNQTYKRLTLKRKTLNIRDIEK